MIHILLRLIGIYQKTLSPDHGWLKVFFPHGACRYEPTCSEYMAQALHHHGWGGVRMGVMRILRCHPFATGGRDDVPASKYAKV